MDQIKRIDSTSDISLPKLYERYRSPAEIVLPYRLTGRSTNLFRIYSESRFKKSLWNMDFPWLVVMGVSLIGAALAAVVVFFSKLIIAATAGSSAVLALSVFGAFPIFFALLSPLAYPFSVICNLEKGWGNDWTRTLLGPTHIGLTDSGFKLYVRGFYFYNFPNLAIWPEVFQVELVTDRVYNTVALRFVYQTGFGRAPIQLPLCGFASSEDLLFVLTNFADHVEPSHQGEFIKEMAAVKFAPIIEAFEEGSLGTLEQKLLLEQAVLEPAQLEQPEVEKAELEQEQPEVEKAELEQELAHTGMEQVEPKQTEVDETEHAKLKITESAELKIEE